MSQLTEHIAVKTISETATDGVFEIEGLYAGYGVTLGNTLRRVLLSSLEGAAITQAKIKGAGHKFTTLPNVLEDVVELTMNLKKIRFRMTGNEPQVLRLKKKGEGDVLAGEFETGPQISVVTPDVKVATLTDKKADFDIEITVERGMGYSSVESRKIETVPIGVLLIDALYSPVLHVDFKVENMRVGEKIDYNRLRIMVTTDGTISPSKALQEGTAIARNHFGVVSEKISVVETASGGEEPKVKKKSKKGAKADNEDSEV